MWHLSDAWSRRGEPNVLLVHYDDLSADLEGQMRWLAGQLGIAVPEQAWPALVQAATFESMRGSADTLVPTAGIFKSNAAFFRRGTSGAGREILSDEEIAGLPRPRSQLAPPDMLTWLHAPQPGLGRTGRRRKLNLSGPGHGHDGGRGPAGPVGGPGEDGGRLVP